jgi:hypothetical protein
MWFEPQAALRALWGRLWFETTANRGGKKGGVISQAWL